MRVALAAAAALAASGPVAAQGIVRLAVLPFEASAEDADWLAWVMPVAIERALATNSLIDITRPAEWSEATRQLGLSPREAARDNRVALAAVLNLDVAICGWVSCDLDAFLMDVEVLRIPGGERIAAQSFRGPIADPLPTAVLAASFASESATGAPLLTYAREAGAPREATPAALRAYGEGLAALDRARGAEARGNHDSRLEALVAASDALAEAVKLAPSLLWHYDALLEASSGIVAMASDLGAAYVNMAVARRALGEHSEALAVLRAGVAAASTDASVRVALAALLLDMAAVSPAEADALRKEALAEATEAARLAATAPDAWQVLGAAQFEAGKFDDAASSYRRAAELRPDDPISLLGLGLALARLGLWEEARPHLLRVLQLDTGARAERARSELRRMGML